MASICSASLTLTRKSTIAHQIMKHWKSMNLKRSRRQYNNISSSSTINIPSGFLVVYVGAERMRFLIPVRFLQLPVFISLLHKAEEEYGFKFSGGIVLPCDVDFFQQLLSFLHKDENKYGRFHFNDFFELISSCKLQLQLAHLNSSSVYDRLLTSASS